MLKSWVRHRFLSFSPAHVTKFVIVGGAGRAMSYRYYTGPHMVEPSRHATGYHAFQDLLDRIKLESVDERIRGDVEKLYDP